jgi:membrane-associated phospholipid phosphatase
MAPGHRALNWTDESLLAVVVAHRPESWAAPARQLTGLATPPVVIPAVAGAAGWAALHHSSTRTLVGIVASNFAGIVVRRCLAEAIGRDRPPSRWWWDQPSGPSYPSRHATWAALGSQAVADLLRAADVHPQPGLMEVGMPAVVAATRVLLAVHWPSDVAAALVFARAWRQLTAVHSSTGRPTGRGHVHRQEHPGLLTGGPTGGHGRIRTCGTRFRNAFCG